MDPGTVGWIGPLAAGRAALSRADWSEAQARFQEAVAAEDTPEAWDGLSRAAWWQGDQDATLGARERAYRGYRRAGEPCGAARMAMWLASDHLDFRGDDAVASAWLRRGRALVADHPPCPEQGWITLLEADIALWPPAIRRPPSVGHSRRSTSRGASRTSTSRSWAWRSSAAR